MVDNAKARIHLKQETKTAQAEQDQLIARKKVADEKRQKYQAERKLERAPKEDVIDELQLDMDLRSKWKQHQEGDTPSSPQSADDQKYDEAVGRAAKQKQWEIDMEMGAPMRTLEALDAWRRRERRKILEADFPPTEEEERLDWLEERYQRKRREIMGRGTEGQVFTDE
jgi:hypothetical protein